MKCIRCVYTQHTSNGFHAPNIQRNSTYGFNLWSLICFIDSPTPHFLILFHLIPISTQVLFHIHTHTPTLCFLRSYLFPTYRLPYSFGCVTIVVSWCSTNFQWNFQTCRIAKDLFETNDRRTHNTGDASHSHTYIYNINIHPWNVNKKYSFEAYHLLLLSRSHFYYGIINHFIKYDVNEARIVKENYWVNAEFEWINTTKIVVWEEYSNNSNVATSTTTTEKTMTMTTTTNFHCPMNNWSRKHSFSVLLN